MGYNGHSDPGFFGTKNHYDSKGNKTGYSEPGFFGNINHYDSKGNKTGHTEPGIFGGYNHYDAKGNKIGHSDPGLLGGYNHYDNKGHSTGSSTPGFFGTYNHSDEEGCYIATCVYGSYDCPEVWVLRRYRDFSLAKTPFGRAFIKCYYALSPKLVAKLGEKNWFRTFWIRKLNKKIGLLKEKGFSDKPYEDKSRR